MTKANAVLLCLYLLSFHLGGALKVKHRHSSNRLLNQSRIAHWNVICLRSWPFEFESWLDRGDIIDHSLPLSIVRQLEWFLTFCTQHIYCANTNSSYFKESFVQLDNNIKLKAGCIYCNSNYDPKNPPPCRDLNPRPPWYQSNALPTELSYWNE